MRIVIAIVVILGLTYFYSRTNNSTDSEFIDSDDHDDNQSTDLKLKAKSYPKQELNSKTRSKPSSNKSFVKNDTKMVPVYKKTINKVAELTQKVIEVSNKTLSKQEILKLFKELDITPTRVDDLSEEIGSFVTYKGSNPDIGVLELAIMFNSDSKGKTSDIERFDYSLTPTMDNFEALVQNLSKKYSNPRKPLNSNAFFTQWDVDDKDMVLWASIYEEEDFENKTKISVLKASYEFDNSHEHFEDE